MKPTKILWSFIIWEIFWGVYLSHIIERFLMSVIGVIIFVPAYFYLKKINELKKNG